MTKVVVDGTSSLLELLAVIKLPQKEFGRLEEMLNRVEEVIDLSVVLSGDNGCGLIELVLLCPGLLSLLLLSIADVP